MDLPSLSDAELLARIPDPGAVAAFYERHVDDVLRFALRRCSDPADAADLMSIVFLEVFDSAAGYDERRGGARPWLYGIATRCLADLRAGGARQREIARRLGARPGFDDDEYERAEQMIDAAQRGPEVRAALSGALGEGEREMFLLVAADGLSPGEAARALGLRPVAGRVRRARARRKLRATLGAADELPSAQRLAPANHER
jgi:RNA polymerase sigma-70 factor (ECF subfamily)